MRRPSGELITLDMSLHPIRNEQGEVVLIVPEGRDITERKRAEESLQHSNGELMRANRELEEFGYVASHDLQEPLRMVNIYTQLILRDLRRDDPELNQYAAFVKQGVNRMETLIRDLLRFSQSREQDDLSVGTADLSAALKEALSVLENRIEVSGAAIHVETLPLVRGNTLQLAHVFQNLLSNAIKYRRLRGASDDSGLRGAGRHFLDHHAPGQRNWLRTAICRSDLRTVQAAPQGRIPGNVVSAWQSVVESLNVMEGESGLRVNPAREQPFIWHCFLFPKLNKRRQISALVSVTRLGDKSDLAQVPVLARFAGNLQNAGKSEPFVATVPWAVFPQMQRVDDRDQKQRQPVVRKSSTLAHSVVFLALASTCYYYSSRSADSSSIGHLRLEMTKLKQEMANSQDLRGVRRSLRRVARDLQTMNEQLSPSR